jgi:hypothetical protein
VNDRTSAPALDVLAAVAIAVFSFYTLTTAVFAQNWAHATFAALNGLLTTYGIVAFIGVRNAVVDVVLGFVRWVRVPARPARQRHPADGAPAELDWEAVLYFGPDLAPTAPHSGRSAVTETPSARRGDTRARQR